MDPGGEACGGAAVGVPTPRPVSWVLTTLCPQPQWPGRAGAVSTHNLTRATASTSALAHGTETITAPLTNSTSTQNKKFNKENKEVQRRSHQSKHPRLLWLQLPSPSALEAALQNQRSALAATRESPLQQRRPNTAKDK